MAKKKKHSGHYCRICGEYKANEKFSGKGYAQHICKTCMSSSAKKDCKDSDNEDIFVYEDEFIDLISSDIDMDNIDEMPIFCEDKRFKKLDKNEKTALKMLTNDIVQEYWIENRQIPFSESLSEIRKRIIRLYMENYEIRLKDDIELKNYIQVHTIGTINRLLKNEKQ